MRWANWAAPRATALALWLWGLRAASAQKLSGHSIGTPPDINVLAAEWFLAGTVIPTYKGLVLSPGATSRAGVLWCKFPLLTADFEVSLELRVTGPAQHAANYGGMGIWYVYENVTAAGYNLTALNGYDQQELISNTWMFEFANNGFDLMGYRSRFDGLGVIFADDEHPSVSAIGNDGHSHVEYGVKVPAPDALKFEYRNGQKFQVKMRIKPGAAKVEIPGYGSFDIKQDFRSGGYVGVTTFSGITGSHDGKLRSSVVELLSVEIVNYDRSAKGEEVHDIPTAPPQPPQAEREDLIGASSSFKDHRAESEAIKDLTNMVFKLVVQSQPRRSKITRAIESLSERVSQMESKFAQLKAEVDKKSSHKMGEEFESIKQELASLSAEASTHTKERRQKLESLHADVADVHRSSQSADSIDHHLDGLTQSNSKVISQLTTQHQKMFGVSIAAIAFVIIAGLSLYNKFRCWEKKHIL